MRERYQTAGFAGSGRQAGRCYKASSTVRRRRERAEGYRRGRDKSRGLDRTVMPPSPLVSPEAVVGMAVYSARAILHGKGHDVWEMMLESIP
jgi:hypothetical protein